MRIAKSACVAGLLLALRKQARPKNGGKVK
jgi:hypothetical protein